MWYYDIYFLTQPYFNKGIAFSNEANYTVDFKNGWRKSSMSFICQNKHTWAYYANTLPLNNSLLYLNMASLDTAIMIARFMGPKWSPSGADRTQVGRMLALWTLLSGQGLTWPAFRLFAQPFIQAQIKDNIKDPRHWPLWMESTGDRWFPPNRACKAENIHLMTSSWFHFRCILFYI